MADSLWSNVTLACHFDGAAGATTFVDEKGKTIVGHGSAVIADSASDIGGKAGYFPNSSSYLTCVSSTDFDFGSGDFTIEVAAHASGFGADTNLIAKWLGGGDSWIFGAPYGKLRFTYMSAGSQYSIESPSVVFTTTGRKRVAVVRSGNTLSLLADGAVVATGDMAGRSITYSASSNLIFPMGSNVSSMYLDELRITKGVARNAATFAPATSAFEHGLPTETLVLSGAYSVSGQCDVQEATIYTAPSSDGGVVFEGATEPFVADPLRATFTGGHIEAVCSGTYKASGLAVVYVAKTVKRVSANGASYKFKPTGSAQVNVTTLATMAGWYSPVPVTVKNLYPFVSDDALVGQRQRVTVGVQINKLIPSGMP